MLLLLVLFSQAFALRLSPCGTDGKLPLMRDAASAVAQCHGLQGADNVQWRVTPPNRSAIVIATCTGNFCTHYFLPTVFSATRNSGDVSMLNMDIDLLGGSETLQSSVLECRTAESHAACQIAMSSTPAQWTDDLADGSLKYACAGDSVRLPWNVTLSAGQTLEDVQWFYQGGSSQMIAVLTHGTFLPLPAFSNRVAFLSSAGIVLSGVSVQDSGNYSVEVNGHGNDGAFFKIKRTITLQVGADLMTTDGVLHVSENPVAVLDKSSGQWSVELQCGAFTYLGHPPFDVQWTTPTGHLSASSSYSGGQFRLLLPAPLTGGYYHCKIPLSAFTTACLASNSTQKGDANYKLDKTESRLTLLEAHQNALQNENDVLKAENFRLKTADSDMSTRVHQMEAKWSKQVSFHARNLRNTSPQRDSPLIVDHVVTNQGGCYSATTGMFTAPANGTYFFIGSSGPLTAGQTGQLELREDGGGQQESLVSPRALSDQGVAASVQGVVHMQSGDRAWLQVSSPTAFSSAATSFTGFLVSPDP